MAFDKKAVKERLEKANITELKAASTQVVGWYAHSEEVRGPFGRWFTVSKREDDTRKGNLAWWWDDCKYAAAAMMAAPALSDDLLAALTEIEQLESDSKSHIKAWLERVDEVISLRDQIKLLEARLMVAVADRDIKDEAAKNSRYLHLLVQDTVDMQKTKINYLNREIELLRSYGNKDRTHMADEVLREEKKK